MNHNWRCQSLSIPAMIFAINGIVQKPNFEMTTIRLEESCHELSHNERERHILGIMASITVKFSSTTGNSGWRRWETAQPGVLAQETESSMVLKVTTHSVGLAHDSRSLLHFGLKILGICFLSCIQFGSSPWQQDPPARVCMVTWTTESLGL